MRVNFERLFQPGGGSGFPLVGGDGRGDGYACGL
jgi:hypothetical protein